MRDLYYGLTVSADLVEPTAGIALNTSVIDSDVGDVVLRLYTETGGTTFPMSTGLLDVLVADVPMAAPAPTSRGLNLTVAAIDAHVIDVRLQALKLGESTIDLHVARLDVMVGDIPLDANAPLSKGVTLNTALFDVLISDISLAALKPGETSVSLHESVIDSTVMDVSLQTNDPDSGSVNFNTAIVDATVTDVSLVAVGVDDGTLTLTVAVADCLISDVPILAGSADNLMPLTEVIIDAIVSDVPIQPLGLADGSLSYTVALIDAVVIDISLAALDPADASLSLTTAFIDSLIADVPIAALSPQDGPLILNMAAIDAIVGDVSMIPITVGDAGVPLNLATIDCLIADVPFKHRAEAAGFNGAGLLKGPTTNYAKSDATGTVLLWLLVPTDAAEDRRITFAANAGATPRIQFFVESDISGTQVLGIETDDGTVTQTWFFEPDTNIFDGNKHFIAYRGNGNSYQIFIDGVPAAGSEAGVNSGKWFDIQTPAGTDFNQLQIGGFAEPGQNVEFFYGSLDELVHVGQALSNAEILSLWNSGSGATIPEMSAATWWSSVRSAYELAKDDTRNWGDDYLGANDLAEDPAGFLVPGDRLVDGGWTP